MMEINAAMESQIASVRQALGTASLQQAMGQDAATVGKLLEGMEETGEAVREAASSARGIYVDVRV